MSAIAIEKDVPLPPPARRGSKYPFKEMLVGDSFFAGVTPQTLRSVANRWAATGPDDAQFTIRAIVEDGVHGARCWRTA